MKKLILLVLLSGLGLVVRAAVTFPFYDGFDYVSGNNLAAQGSWVAASGSGTIMVGPANLSYAGLTNATGQNVTLIPTGSAARTSLNFAAQSSGTFFISFLLKVNSFPSSQTIIGFASSSTSSDTTPSLGVFIKSTGELAVGINTGTPQFTSAALTAGQTYLVVIGYTFGSTDTADVWVNPASLGGSAPAVTGIASGSDTATLQYFLWNTASGSGGSFAVDEFRLGNTYASVTPPSSFVPDNPAVPRITRAEHDGASLILHGTNGTAGAGYEILCSTNLTLSLAQWSVVASNNFSGSGEFDATNALTPGLGQAFFLLRVGGSTNSSIVTAPSISSQPQNQSAAIGEAAQFSVAATGTPPLNYQWYFNTNTPVAGATNASHLISNVSSNDAGSYQVVVANSAGSVTSIVATLTITPPPTDGDWFVSTTGSDANPGTVDLPFATLPKAISVAQPGQIIYLRGGTYSHGSTIRFTNSGTAGNRISLLAYPGEKPVFDFSTQPYGAANRGFLFTTNGNHWNVKGLEIAYAGDNGIKVEGSYLRFEQCVLHHNGDTGIQIGFGHTDSNPGGLLAAFIDVINCDSYLNYDSDSNGGDADGFAAKMHCGQGIVFQGCRAWENSDDGWDLFETDYSIVISNCWCWKSGVANGNGNGFKLGGNGSGGDSKGTHYALHCVSFGHKVNGFTQNSHKDGEVVAQCLSFANGNSGYNYFFEGSLNSGKQNIFQNNVSVPRSGINTGGFIADNSPVEQNNTWNLAVTASTADYVDVAETAAKAPRQPDGSLPAGFARLVAGSDLIDMGVNIGQPYNGTAPDLGPYEFAP